MKPKKVTLKPKTKPLSMDLYDKQDISQYQATPDEAKLLRQVQERENAMRTRVTRLFPRWNMYRVAYDAEWE